MKYLIDNLIIIFYDVIYDFSSFPILLRGFIVFIFGTLIMTIYYLIRIGYLFMWGGVKEKNIAQLKNILESVYIPSLIKEFLPKKSKIEEYDLYDQSEFSDDNKAILKLLKKDYCKLYFLKQLSIIFFSFRTNNPFIYTKEVKRFNLYLFIMKYVVASSYSKRVLGLKYYCLFRINEIMPIRTSKDGKKIIIGKKKIERSKFNKRLRNNPFKILLFFTYYDKNIFEFFHFLKRNNYRGTLYENIAFLRFFKRIVPQNVSFEKDWFIMGENFYVHEQNIDLSVTYSHYNYVAELVKHYDNMNDNGKELLLFACGAMRINDLTQKAIHSFLEQSATIQIHILNYIVLLKNENDFLNFLQQQEDKKIQQLKILNHSVFFQPNFKFVKNEQNNY